MIGWFSAWLAGFVVLFGPALPPHTAPATPASIAIAPPWIIRHTSADTTVALQAVTHLADTVPHDGVFTAPAWDAAPSPATGRSIDCDRSATARCEWIAPAVLPRLLTAANPA